MSKAPIIALDFDGVLHPEPNPHRPGTTDLFSCLPVLETAVRGLVYRVLITSSWRDYFPLAELRELLGELEPHVVGNTGYMSHMRREENHGRAIRQAEILRWLEVHGETGTPILVLDDYAEWFEPAWSPLYLTNGKTGLRPEDGKAIRIRLSRLQGRI